MDADTRHELSTVAIAVHRALTHHQRRDEHDADLANAPRVTYSPITRALDDALDTLRRLLDDAASA
ncbi:hypothetical protein [Actinokineospora iranica]|uniref:Uncharacterized protein n=1 Tax=Actinokineospora iranica TaxID=1271860 RepID=A0A1G6Y795_9PSEU|nr:hypothetical protein [Actinokineospora iranica]SDD86299.1 hypothetical protein SAMN05216174_12068 [Actinokineospora iranica]